MIFWMQMRFFLVWWTINTLVVASLSKMLVFETSESIAYWTKRNVNWKEVRLLISKNRESVHIIFTTDIRVFNSNLKIFPLYFSLTLFTIKVNEGFFQVFPERFSTRISPADLIRNTIRIICSCKIDFLSDYESILWRGNNFWYPVTVD